MCAANVELDYAHFVWAAGQVLSFDTQTHTIDMSVVQLEKHASVTGEAIP